MSQQAANQIEIRTPKLVDQQPAKVLLGQTMKILIEASRPIFDVARELGILEGFAGCTSCRFAAREIACDASLGLLATCL
ncbi:hypothetical protein [Frankia sp. CcI49]|uniref:hypothetical protein n=1 Tax=Frankia sp. CcI49 TaxID=1745382 RepID=UPI0010569563|nr:hypothetical protein [Frankia sp. CcI49]